MAGQATESKCNDISECKTSNLCHLKANCRNSNGSFEFAVVNGQSKCTFTNLTQYLNNSTSIISYIFPWLT